MITFAKAHAYGNDFLYVPAAEVAGAKLDVLAREMCDRHTGIGADGLIAYEVITDGARMRLFNADGSRAEVSGNGVRGLGALMAQYDTEDGLFLTIETEGGRKVLERTDHAGSQQMFRASMGHPEGIRRVTVDLNGEAVPLVVLNIGNPQAIILGPLPDDDVFTRLGSGLTRHPFFPDGTNIEFVEVESPSRVRIRIWERGVGPSLSSGTGSCASLVAAASFAGVERDAEVAAPGGTQRVEWLDDGVYLTGWAEVLCRGEWVRALPL